MTLNVFLYNIKTCKYNNILIINELIELGLISPVADYRPFDSIVPDLIITCEVYRGFSTEYLYY